MYEVFAQNIRSLYTLIIQPIDIIYKLIAINKYKNSLNFGINDSFGEFYYRFIEKTKDTGVVYTPVEISDYIIKNTVSMERIVKNPYLKILDPACGCGNILIPCYRYLKSLYIDNMDTINSIHSINLNLNNIDKHIIENNIYGYDIDDISIKVLLIDLFLESKSIAQDNFKVEDFLFYEDPDTYDIIIGNPPYVGQKTIDRLYSKKLKLTYLDVYKDKGDLSYCFFKRAIEKTNNCGIISFITSRYFIEAPSGESLRNLLRTELSINKIVDFYGIRPFKNIGIDPIIIFLEKADDAREIEVVKPLGSSKEHSQNFYKSVFFNQGNSHRCFTITKETLKDTWMLIDREEREIIERINAKSLSTLGNICSSYQGIITGCDKAFIVDKEIIKNNKIEPQLIKPWIKSSNIKQFQVEENKMFIIYSDLIKDADKYENSLEYIGRFKDKLSKRRECAKGIREWYQLQWGRKHEIFEAEKIIFPYKADSNKFAIDNGSYFSADVYCLIIKPSMDINYDYLVNILNSKLYEFYFKCYGKKLGDKLYEYYPNTIMRLPIATDIQLKNDFNLDIYNYFGLSNKQIKIIEERIKH